MPGEYNAPVAKRHPPTTLRWLRLIAILGLTCRAAAGAAPGDDRPASPGPRPLILVHYMPWYEAKPVSDGWGWHWTMNHFDPERTDASGRREIASHYYPLIGPYDSADPDVLEYHALLMKVAGIDGVIADWYGNEDFNDYAGINRRTMAVFDTLKARGLRFAVCYEDRALKAMAEKGKWTPEQAVVHARMHLRFCEERWFNEPSYVTWQGKPLLLVFGPDYLQPSQWEAAFAGMKQPPAFFTLHERRAPAVGSFAWPPMWAAKDGTLGVAELDGYLDRYEQRDEPKIAAAFPGFHDIYAQAGARPSYGRLDAAGGETFRRTLARALASGGPFVQVATWNDFGEGTCVEPAREYEYRYLETIQHARRQFADDPFAYETADLRLPLRVYKLRKQFGAAAPERSALDAAVDKIYGGDVTGAGHDLDRLDRAASTPTGHGAPDRSN